MQVPCPSCPKVYETDLGGSSSATIICDGCGQHFDCLVEQHMEPKRKLGPLGFGKVPVWTVKTTVRKS